MEKLNNLRNNCRRATFLIEKRRTDSISIAETIKLYLHLAGCSFCRTFASQSFLINKMMQKMSKTPVPDDIRLSKEDKIKMQEAIKRKLGDQG